MRGFVFALASAVLALTVHGAQPTQPAQPASVAAGYGNLPLSFEANLGQTAPQVRFTSRGNGYALFLTQSEAVLALSRSGPGRGQDTAKGVVVRMKIVGANRAAQVSGANQLPGVANYFIGNDPALWRVNIPTFAQVRYANLYPSVDLLFYGNHRQLEFDFVLAPGADPATVRLQFSGVRNLRVAADGSLTLAAVNGKIAFHKPEIYQIAGGRKHPIRGSFARLAENCVGFTLGTYDRSRPLVIDPILAYSTYLGGSGSDSATSVSVDSQGDAYLTGSTTSTDFPVTQGAFQPHHSTGTAFVARVNPQGTELLYSTYLGGTGGDIGNAIAVDEKGNAYVTGLTASTNFPVTSGALQLHNNSQNGQGNSFVARLNPEGAKLLYSTYLGGSGGEYSGQDPNYPSAPGGDSAHGIAVDSDGNAYVAGQAFSPDFPVTSGAFETKNQPAQNLSGSNCFISKINPAGTTLTYSTFLGGSGDDLDPGDSCSGIKIDSSGNAFVTGTTYSTNFPTTSGAFQPNYPGTQWYYDVVSPVNNSSTAFASKLNNTGSGLLFSTYLGGSGFGIDCDPGNDTCAEYPGDGALGLALDSSGSMYIVGNTTSSNFPTTEGAFLTRENVVTPSFVTKLSPDGSAVLYSTFLNLSYIRGATVFDGATAIAVDASDSAIVVGLGYTGDFPVTAGALQTKSNGNGTNAFLIKLNREGSAVAYGTYFGGSAKSGDQANGVALDTLGNAYFCGFATSTNFPVSVGAFQSRNNSRAGQNAFIAKLNIGSQSFPDSTSTKLHAGPNPQLLGQPVAITATVTAKKGSPAPDGSVLFSVNGETVASVPLTAEGTAAYSSRTIPVGIDTLKATYPGTTTFAASGDTIAETILPDPPVFSVLAGVYHSTQSVALSDSTRNAAIYFTTNGDTPTSSSTRYTKPVSVAASTTIRAIAITASGLRSPVASSAYTLVAANPVFSPAAGTYDSPQTVRIASSTPGSAIYYTTNGATPTKASTRYTVAGIPVSKTTTLKAIAIAPGYSASPVASATYTITPPAPVPTFAPAAGTYTSAQTVKLADKLTAGLEIFYTTNGATPTTTSTKYTSAGIKVSSTETIKAIALATGYSVSPIATATYTIK